MNCVKRYGKLCWTQKYIANIKVKLGDEENILRKYIRYKEEKNTFRNNSFTLKGLIRFFNKKRNTQ